MITYENGDELKIIKLTFLLIIFSFVFGCGDEPGKPTDNNSELLPLKVGNQWTYAYTTFNSDGDSNHTERQRGIKAVNHLTFPMFYTLHLPNQ